ncbi:hypothetical protein AB3M83_01985 [Microbacterium sp. 179-B 1A2 NHS]|uniref:hypothetical protein n=1 Tax=Microbacterium sp. 179-B 1A2 NHS TaxID=3142383 RepID=UPI0039A0989F
MEGLWTFLGSYWWLAFPAFGLLSAGGNAWASASKRRHKRRLEVIKAKAELAAAKRGIGAATTSEAAAPAPTLAAQVDELRDVHDEVTKRWLDYELDVAKLIAFPSMSDGREPLTADFLRAKKVADRARPAEGTKPSVETVAAYRAAVTDFEVAFDLAEREARRVRDSGFSESERKRLATASRLLAVATDEAATPAERHLAYQRVREEIDGLIALSDEAVEVLEKKIARELPPGERS